jgi:ribosomal-protein-alanine N-acetyltransferase
MVAREPVRRPGRFSGTRRGGGTRRDRLSSLAGVDHVLTTERLVLRPVTMHDHAVLLAHWILPDVRRFLFDGAALSATEVTETIEESVRDFAAGGYGVWLIQEAARAELVGTAGLRSLEDLGLEIFYSLAPGSWGHGYATEAALAVVEHALGSLGLPEVLAEVDEGNAASVAVVKRLGMTAFAVVPGVLGPMTSYRKTAETLNQRTSFPA